MPENVGRNARHQFSVYANSNIAKIWHTNNSLNFIAGHEKVNNATEDIVAVGFNSTNQISIGEKAAVNINMEFRPKTKTVNYIYNSEYCIDLGAYYRFNKNLYLNVTLGNILRNHAKITMRGNNYKLIRYDKSNLARLSLDLTWNFSTGKVKKVKARAVERFELKHAEL